jgi:glycosyltransferase involved in cell wall biosynthesis
MGVAIPASGLGSPPGDEPLVSVITIFLNEKRFLPEAIRSVLAQTYPQWELLLIDDGSTDGSTDIAREYAELHPGRIRYLQHAGHQNRGKSVSRNLGLQQATGQYVTFLDADDVFRPEKLACQARLLTEQPVAMVYGHTLYWRDWSESPTPGGTRKNATGRLGVAPDRCYPPPQLLRLFLTDPGTVPCICGLVVRRSVALDVGGFDERIEHLFEDQVFLARICARHPVYVERGCRDLYRQHEQSTSHQAILTGHYHPTQPNPSHRAYLDWLQGHLAEIGIHDPALHRALEEALWPYHHPILYRFLCLVRWAAWRRKRIRRRTLAEVQGTSP